MPQKRQELTCNQLIGGASPSSGSKFMRMFSSKYEVVAIGQEAAYYYKLFNDIKNNHEAEKLLFDEIRKRYDIKIDEGLTLSGEAIILVKY